MIPMAHANVSTQYEMCVFWFGMYILTIQCANTILPNVHSSNSVQLL